MGPPIYGRVLLNLHSFSQVAVGFGIDMPTNLGRTIDVGLILSGLKHESVPVGPVSGKSPESPRQSVEQLVL